MSTERDNLEIHVDLCELRYKQLDDRMTRVENKIEDINRDLRDFKDEVREQFDQLKNLLGQAKDQKFNTMVGAGASVVVGLLALLGYIVVHVR
jgi:chromosome segregation ATPase